MSRCFPYPPPGYCRNGATYEALIESIKLQKETDKTKAERKKEKRAKKEKKEKRQKEKKNKEDEIKLQKNTNGDTCKVLQKAADCTKAQMKGTNATTEQFEKSDLTEEHGLPTGSHQPSYSSDSTTNSNKRKRDHASLQPDNSTGHGKPIKILLLKKHKGSDCSNFGADARSNSHPSSNTLNGVAATPGRENTTQTKSTPISGGTKISDTNRLRFRKIKPVPSSAKPVVQSTRPPQQPSLSFGRQVLPQIHLEQEIPSCSLSRNIDEQQKPAPSHNGMPDLATSKPSTSAAAKRSINDITVPRNDDLTSRKKQKEDPQKVGPTRFEKKMLKKHTKYERLVGSWVPPVLQAHLPDVAGDEDWLSGSKTLNSPISRGEVEGEARRQLIAPWQPCARFLAEVGMHALPYTVPF